MILTKSISRFERNTLDTVRTLRTLNHCDTEDYFEQENIRLSAQHIQILLAAYCALAQAESEEKAETSNGGLSEAFKAVHPAMLNLYVLVTNREMAENWKLVSRMQ